MKNTVTVFCKNTNAYHTVPIGTSLLDIHRQLDIKLKYPIVAARVNYKVEDLNFPVYNPKDIEFIDISTASGMRVYVRSLCMVMCKAVSELFPSANLRILHSISKGYYCSLEGVEQPVSVDIVNKIKKRMSEIIAEGAVIHTEEKRTDEVKELFVAANQKDKVRLFDTLGNPYCRYFRIDNYIDYYTGVLMPNTNYLNIYDLSPYSNGILLRIPSRNNPSVIEECVEQPKMLDIFREYGRWNKIMNMGTIGDFNTALKNNQAFDLIKIAEALHEKKIASIADMIYAREGKVRIVLIAGPSSSGKTTFSKRLSVQLQVIGMQPVAISMDNYFVNRNDTPKDENGDFDYEHINALDLPLFNQHIQQLLEGQEIEMPFYNFEKGAREFRGNKLKLKENTILILEGIHALNPELLAKVATEAMFKIYVSALTTIAIDNHNWISTADTRLLRRIIRDASFRHYSARDTISRWDSVRRGEDKWIFPFQENADVMFNSALLFELNVLKRHAEPALNEVPKYCDEYTEAHRLLKFLRYFIPIPEREIPPTSLLREFVGGSSFRY